jgi:hypothetical protein
MKSWFWALYRKLKGLENASDRIEDFYEITIFQRSRGGFRAQGFYDPMDGDGMARDGKSMMDALSALLLAQHEKREKNED